MESALLGIVLDSSILIAAERRKLRPEQAIESVQKTVGEVPIVLCSLTSPKLVTGSIVLIRRNPVAAEGSSWMN